MSLDYIKSIPNVDYIFLFGILSLIFILGYILKLEYSIDKKNRKIKELEDELSRFKITTKHSKPFIIEKKVEPIVLRSTHKIQKDSYKRQKDIVKNQMIKKLVNEIDKAGLIEVNEIELELYKDRMYTGMLTLECELTILPPSKH